MRLLNMIARTLFVFLIVTSTVFASPFMVTDPCPGVIGGRYEILEVTALFPNGRLAYSNPLEADGSLKMDLNSVPVGTHRWRVRHEMNGETSTYVECVLVVSVLFYKTTSKTFKYYSFNKSWVLKAP